MANVKHMEGQGDTGNAASYYFECWDEAGLFCDNADGVFRYPPADYLLPVTEIGATGVYYRDEDRAVWADGKYYYRLVDGSGNTIATGGEIEIEDDIPVDYAVKVTLLNKIYQSLLDAIGIGGR